MEDKFFDMDEAMVEYAEMTSFDFNSGNYLAFTAQKEAGEYSNQPYTFKYGNFDVVDMLKSLFCKASLQKN